MYDSLIVLALYVAALGAGLMAGVYFAFSGFIMRSLDQLGAARAADAMNAINEVILRSWFMPLFFGSTLLYSILAALAVFDQDLPGRGLLIIAGLVYVVGMFLCTAIFNVPLNNRLANAGGDDTSRAESWQRYLAHWTRWNHLRAGCSLVSCLLTIQCLAQLN